MPASLSRLTAIVVLLAATTSASASVNVSIFSRLQEIADPFLDRIGVDYDLSKFKVDLPPRAEEAVNRAFGRVESALGRVRDHLDKSYVTDDVLDGGLLDGGNLGDLLGDLDLPNIDLPNIDIPSINLPDLDLPDVDQIVSDAVGRARDRVEGALGRVRSKVEGVLGDLEDRIPSVLDDLLHDDGVLDGVLDHLKDSGVGTIIEDALGDLPSKVDGVIEQVLDDVHDRDPLNNVLNNLPEDLIPPSVFTTLETIFNRVDGVSLSQQAAVGVPEPTSGVLLMLAGGLGFARRR